MDSGCGFVVCDVMCGFLWMVYVFIVDCVLFVKCSWFKYKNKVIFMNNKLVIVFII